MLLQCFSIISIIAIILISACMDSHLNFGKFGIRLRRSDDVLDRGTPRSRVLRRHPEAQMGILYIFAPSFGRAGRQDLGAGTEVFCAMMTEDQQFSKYQSDLRRGDPIGKQRKSVEHEPSRTGLSAVRPRRISGGMRRGASFRVSSKTIFSSLLLFPQDAGLFQRSGCTHGRSITWKSLPGGRHVWWPRDS